MEEIKYLEKMKIVPSDLSSGGSPGSYKDFDLESELELELELLGSKPRTGSRTFPLTTLVGLGREGEIKSTTFPSIWFLYILLIHLGGFHFRDFHLENGGTHPCRSRR